MNTATTTPAIDGDDSSALISIALEPDGTRLTAAELFTDKEIDDVLARVESIIDVELRGILGDVTDEKYRKAIASLAYKVARSKTAIDDVGKRFVAELKKRPGEIDALRRKAWDRLEKLQAEIRKPVTDWETAQREAEEAERRRVEQARLAREAEERAELERRQAEVKRQADELAERERAAAERERVLAEREAKLAPEPEPAPVTAEERTAAIVRIGGEILGAIETKRAADIEDDFAEDEAAEGILALAQTLDTHEAVATTLVAAADPAITSEYERRRGINRAVHAALMQHAHLDDNAAKGVLYTIIHGLIPSVTITY